MAASRASSSVVVTVVSGGGQSILRPRRKPTDSRPWALARSLLGPGHPLPQRHHLGRLGLLLVRPLHHPPRPPLGVLADRRKHAVRAPAHLLPVLQVFQVQFL